MALTGTLWWCGRHRDRIGPGGTVLWAVLAASLLFSPIAWHNYLTLLWPGVLVLIVLGRGAITTAAFAVTIIPAAWDSLWPPHGIVADVGRSLYCAILVGYWVALLRGSTLSAPGSSGSPRTTTGKASVAATSV